MSMGQPVTTTSDGAASHVLETPFASDGFARTGPVAVIPSTRAFERAFEQQTPFLSEYGFEGNAALAGPRAELFATLMSEFHDSEFEAAVTDLVHEAAAMAHDQFSYEGADAMSERQESMQGLRELFEPLERESVAAIEGLEAHLGEADYSTLSEAEFEAFLDRFEPESAALSPAFEDFFKKLVKKAKGVVRGAVKLAKKGVKLASKLSPINLVLGRLKKLVKPLLERVLRVAVDKLPVAVQPIARQLAKKYLGIGTADAPADAEPGEPAAADPADATRALDTKLAAQVLNGDGADGAGADSPPEEKDESSAETWRRLQRARRRFARRIGELEDEAEAKPVVEEFVPVVLAGLKLGIKIVGRPRVISFLSGLLAKLIQKYVGKAQAGMLSKALVDAGLRLVNLEAESEPVAPAGEALAATLEDTVNRLVQSAPEAAWQDEAVIEGYVREAFARAASAHFPDSEIRGDLHEAAESSGVWELLPRGSATKLYKKYSRVLEVTLTPQLAEAVKSFGDVTLSRTLRDQLGVPAQATVRARMHLYEVLAGTTVGSIAKGEKGVRGLGHAGRGAWSMLHPLTPEAAGALLKEPALGKAAQPRFLADRNVLEIGQRLYYLELPESFMRPRPNRSLQRIGGTKVVLDLPGGTVRIRRYFSEADAQSLATALRKRAPLGVILGMLRSGFESRLAKLFSGSPTRGLRIVHEAVPAESLLPSNVAILLKAAGRPVTEALTKWVLDAFTRELRDRYDALATDIVRAADADADGVSVVVSFSRAPFLGALRELLGGNVAAVGRMNQALRQAPEHSLAVRAGYARV
jgi:hypothetical protein